jgi:hypothetical protein
VPRRTGLVRSGVAHYIPFLALTQTSQPFGAPETEHADVEAFAGTLGRLLDVLAHETADAVIASDHRIVEHVHHKRAHQGKDSVPLTAARRAQRSGLCHVAGLHLSRPG